MFSSQGVSDAECLNLVLQQQEQEILILRGYVANLLTIVESYGRRCRYLRPIFPSPSSTKVPKNKQPEKAMVSELQQELGGITEVKVRDNGRIDLLTLTEIIEVKSVDGWKGAIGQLIAYEEAIKPLKRTKRSLKGPLQCQRRERSGQCSYLV